MMPIHQQLMNGHHSPDYCIWDILQDLVYEGQRFAFASLQDLKEAIKNKWKEVTIETVRKSIAQWNKNLAIANRSHVSCAHNTLRASIGIKYYTVTLKSRLKVTQGHWKRNHWIDHTRLSSSRVI